MTMQTTLALLMLRFGPQLYAHSFGASQPQVDQWTRLTTHWSKPIVAVTGD